MKEQAYNKEQRERPRPHKLNDKSNLIDLMKECPSMNHLNCTIQEGSKRVANYVLKMKGYVEKLERLGYVLPQHITVGLILNGLTKDFIGFVRNYNMHNMGNTIGEIHAMLIEYEKGLPKKAVVENTTSNNDLRGKIQRPIRNRLSKKGNNYGLKEREKNKNKRNCPVYLAELLKKKKQVGSASSSDNCHYAPTITRGVVSVSRLVDNGFVQCFTDYGISVSKNDVLYFNAIARNGIYEIDMHDLVPNVNSIYNVSNKRVKRNLDSTYLWHCHLAHINNKMIKKPFPHSNEREKDLLGIIHTDVCGPLRHVLRQEYTRLDIPEFRDTLIQNMDSVKKSIEKRALHKMKYDNRVNERLMQTTEEKVDSSKALDASLVIIESNGTESQEQDTSSRSGNDAHVDDADIRPIYNEEPMVEVQTTAEINVFAIGQQHTEQPKLNNEGEPEFNNEGNVDQNAEQCHDIRPLPAKLTDDKPLNSQINHHSSLKMISLTNVESNKALNVSAGVLSSLKYRYIVLSYRGRTQSLVAKKKDISENRASRNFDLMIIR
ncbi:hypothetical protein Tco_0974630 [Tanacetum coccineum]|uniref:GAG-pre-integrase domain-containing protein n=1 Tax=Tanacetum coccineum TaxID=301880 RepID=A0ABQ5ECC6_9ASTR